MTAQKRAVAGWVLFDVATQPFFTLITTFVFAPFFAARIAETPAQGQALWGFATGAAGLAIAILSPLLGAVADRTGRRKLWIAAFSVPLVVGSAMLWFAVPGAPYAVWIALAGFAVATMGAEFATAFTNAMMPSLAPPEKLGRLSGLGWAMGYVGGLVALALVLVFLSADPQDGETIAGLHPPFGLDPATNEGDRIVGPLVGLWYLAFVAPLFLFTPDIARRGMAIGAAAKAGLADLKATLGDLGRNRNLLIFLLAHMLYLDGLVALFALGGIYGSGVLGWDSVEVGLFGILVIVAGIFGALLGGKLDDAFGPQRVVAWSLALLTAAAVAIASIEPARILFVIPVRPPAADAAMFSSAPERLFIALAVVLGGAAGPLQAASRTLLVRIAPKDKLTQAFGLFALSGKVTSFLGPTAVAVLTTLTDSQRVGVTALIVFFLLGGALLAAVRVPPVSRA